MGASRIFSSSSLVEPATIELEPAREPPLILQATTAICKFLFEAIVIFRIPGCINAHSRRRLRASLFVYFTKSR